MLLSQQGCDLNGSSCQLEHGGNFDICNDLNGPKWCEGEVRMGAHPNSLDQKGHGMMHSLWVVSDGY